MGPNGHGETYVFAKIYHNLDNQYIYNLIPHILSSYLLTSLEDYYRLKRNDINEGLMLIKSLRRNDRRSKRVFNLQ